MKEGFGEHEEGRTQHEKVWAFLLFLCLTVKAKMITLSDIVYVEEIIKAIVL
jgi:hypothetical protein